ncbi:subtilase family protein [Dorcoceras hygrometricum]|uniref:Subtilase family protein n=1 Tax=Dorcoceras hygrometricum TaxID=472368 RepID=A0A2Z7AGW0_9LAMI|nr:subtilase family protein [Dorcoceras hygrometricum]
MKLNTHNKATAAQHIATEKFTYFRLGTSTSSDYVPSSQLAARRSAESTQLSTHHSGQLAMLYSAYDDFRSAHTPRSRVVTLEARMDPSSRTNTHGDDDEDPDYSEVGTVMTKLTPPRLIVIPTHSFS